MAIQKTYSSEKEIAEIWKLFRETREQMQETDRQMKETDRKMQETDRQMKQTDRRLKKLDDLFNGQWGKLIESLTAGGLKSALQERNIKVTGISCNTERTYRGQKREFDIIATNGEELIVVEVKTTLKLNQVQYFLEKVKDFKSYFSEYKDKKIYGAIAYLRAHEGASNYAEKRGFFILNPVGNIVKIANSAHFRPKQMA